MDANLRLWIGQILLALVFLVDRRPGRVRPVRRCPALTG